MFIIKENNNLFGRKVGSIKIYENRSCSDCLGELDYEINQNSNKLNISNLISYVKNLGIGTRLMSEAVKIAKKQVLNIEFEAAKGSSGFYKKWLKKTFSLKLKGGIKINKTIHLPNELFCIA